MIEFIKQGQMFIIPLAVLIITQFIKIFISIIKHRKITWKSFFYYGSFPSSHSALFVSLATIVWLNEGYNSAVFAIALIMAIIFIRDAMGLRAIMSREGKLLNKLNFLTKGELMPERVGHTPLEVFVGGVIGFSATVACYFLLLGV
ncbi:divergent PAP2 family protein [Patescibacteria group bacterium]|nr:divergent PAP2 family protein [Patescibacteria group bacterium]